MSPKWPRIHYIDQGGLSQPKFMSSSASRVLGLKMFSFEGVLAQLGTEFLKVQLWEKSHPSSTLSYACTEESNWTQDVKCFGQRETRYTFLAGSSLSLASRGRNSQSRADGKSQMQTYCISPSDFFVYQCGTQELR